MANTEPFSRSWPAGRFTATLTITAPKPGEPTHASIEWSPEMPERLTHEEFGQYQRGRNAAFAELAALLGDARRIAVLDVG